MKVPKSIAETALHPPDMYASTATSSKQEYAPRRFRAIGQKFIGSPSSRLGLSGLIHSYPSITYKSMVDMYSGSDSDEDLCHHFNWYKLYHPDASMKVPKSIAETALHPPDMYASTATSSKQEYAPRRFRAIGQKFIGSPSSRLGLSGLIHSYPSITYKSMVDMYSGSDSDEEIQVEESSLEDFKFELSSKFQDSRSWNPNPRDWESIRRSPLDICLCKRKFLSFMVSLFGNYGSHITNPCFPEIDTVSPKLKLSDAKFEDLDSKAFLVRSLMQQPAYSSMSRKKNLLNKSPHSVGNSVGVQLDPSPENDVNGNRQLSRIFNFETFVDESDSERSPFLGCFVNTQMFSAFLQDRIRRDRADLFESAVLEYKKRLSIRNRRLFLPLIRGNLWKFSFKTNSWNYRYFEFENNWISYYSAQNELLLATDEALRLQEIFEINGGDSTEDVQKRRSALNKMNQLKRKHFKAKFYLDPNAAELFTPKDRSLRYKTEFVFGIKLPSKSMICCAEDSRSREEWFQGILASMSRSPQEFLRNRSQKNRPSHPMVMKSADKKRDSLLNLPKASGVGTDTDNSHHSSESEDKSSLSRSKNRTGAMPSIFVQKLEFEQKD
eukprot:TRINITY_DN38096_c0_g2_i1.p1 TRINITY_DN38096_c0_g2~~TRINITY_DN38096_c0_g2_i1.p1  ORF type:complete len:632 (-),score=129.35 TRINITY_DN38096_c0_g2_i1:3129-4952(-)